MSDPVWTQPHHDGSALYVRWLGIDDEALTFLREAPGETVLVHAARAAHAPVRIPAAVVGRELAGMAGTADLRAGRDVMVTLPPDGPAFGMWRLRDV